MSWTRTVAVTVTLLCAITPHGFASDHADIPAVGDPALARPDLNWTDLHVFTVDEGGEPQLVLVASIDATVPVGFRGNYIFATDATVRFIIDNQAERNVPGGVLHDVIDDLSFDVTFATVTGAEGARSVPTVVARRFGDDADAEKNPGWVRVFAGAADDPFIRGPRQGRNVAAIVLQMPLARALPAGEDVLRVWGTTEWPRKKGDQVELNGRALRSMQERSLNTQHPSVHAFEPDVVTLDVTQPVVFPNGRLLTDDVVDVVPELGLRGQDVRSSDGCGNVALGTYTNCVTANENPFSPVFPYVLPPN
jgi:hypothetical protein